LLFLSVLNIFQVVLSILGWCVICQFPVSPAPFWFLSLVLVVWNIRPNCCLLSPPD